MRFQHLTSKIHRGSTVICPFCKTKYTSASGLTHHLERGACPNAPHLTRETIHRMVRGNDPQGLITKQNSDWSEDMDIEYSATDYAFNGRFWQCYLCKKNFNTVQSLNAHLNSSVHKQKVYHCPNTRCSKKFVTLAALFNHLESETCSFIRFEGVQRRLQDVLSGRKLIAF